MANSSCFLSLFYGSSPAGYLLTKYSFFLYLSGINGTYSAVCAKDFLPLLYLPHCIKKARLYIKDESPRVTTLNSAMPRGHHPHRLSSNSLTR